MRPLPTHYQLFRNSKHISYLQVIHDDSKDLTGFPEGVRSIILEKNVQRWQVFTEKEFHGAQNTLDPGRVYKTLDDMGLGSPVLSLRKFYKVISDMTLNKVYQGTTALILLMLYFSFFSNAALFFSIVRRRRVRRRSAGKGKDNFSQNPWSSWCTMMRFLCLWIKLEILSNALKRYMNNYSTLSWIVSRDF